MRVGDMDPFPPLLKLFPDSNCVRRAFTDGRNLPFDVGELDSLGGGVF